MVTRSLQRLSQTLGYTFRNTGLLEQALTHRSLQTVHNERLEFLGDAVLGMIIAVALFRRHPTASEGELSTMRAALVCEPMLVTLAQEFQLVDYVRVGASELGQYKKRPALLADALEAVIGAIYLDGAFPSCEVCILRWYKDRLESVKAVMPVKDSKTALQEYLQACRQVLPRYQLINQTGSPHKPMFTVTCELPGRDGFPLMQGMGKTRREAEQQAATKSLALLQQHDHAKPLSDALNKQLDDN